MGDEAYAQHFYEDAVRYFEEALNVPGIEEADRSRVSEKLASALFFSGQPESANPWFERALEGYLNTAKTNEKTVQVLLRMAPQRWLDCKTKATLPVIARAIKLAETNNDMYSHKRANVLMAAYLHALSRHKDAEEFIRFAGDLTEEVFAPIRPLFYDHRAICAAAIGDRETAFEDFERAVRVSRQQQHPNGGYRLTTVWDDYALWATALGKIDVAKACHERALLVARQDQILWRIPYLCLRYADLLVRIGQFDIAYEYLNDALFYDIRTPRIAMLLVFVGIPLALRQNDEKTLARCAWVPAIDLAFQSGEGVLVGRIAAAFAQFFRAHGREREARSLVHRAIGAVHEVDLCWELPFEIARVGSNTDVLNARALLERRATLPSAEVAQAFLALFDAQVAKRRGKLAESRVAANEAMQSFRLLRWHAYADMADALTRSTEPTGALRVSIGYQRPFSGMTPALTLRERQVAELVLKGLTNRVIAMELSISENTVETHMASIMNRLGIRSRHQLVDVFSESEI